MIDEAAVAAAVSVDQKPKETKPLPPPPPPPPPEVTAADPNPAPATEVVPAKPVQPATWNNSAPETGGVGDLPLPVIGVGVLAAFAAATFAMRGRDEVADEAGGSSAAAVPSEPTPTAIASEPAAAEGDVSIPYDAAARLAYDEWRIANNKGSYDDGKFQTFKTKYEQVTVANMLAKKQARDSGDSPTLQSLPSNADE